MAATLTRKRPPENPTVHAARTGAGERFRLARQQKGLTLEEVGEALGIVRQSVSKWEASETLPIGERLRTVAALYGVSTDWLLDNATKRLAETTAIYSAGEPPPSEEEARLLREFLRFIRRQQPRPPEAEKDGPP